VNETIQRYEQLLRDVQGARYEFANFDLDTGAKPAPKEYVLSDRAYLLLLAKLDQRGLTNVSPDLRDNILDFYSQGVPPRRTRKEKKQWCKALDALWTLNSSAMAERRKNRPKPYLFNSPQTEKDPPSSN
jgi:hypothetical protein